MKKCKKYLNLISASIDGALSEKEEKLLQKHLIECESCKSTREEMEKISKEIKKIKLIPQEKPSFKIDKIKLQRYYKFQISNFFPLLFALIFFVLVFLLWQNLKVKGYPFCIEIKEKIENKFPYLIKRINIEKEVPEDLFIVLELDLKGDKKEIKVLETNYNKYSYFFLKELEKWEWENFKEKKYYLKIYRCP